MFTLMLPGQDSGSPGAIKRLLKFNVVICVSRGGDKVITWRVTETWL